MEKIILTESPNHPNQIYISECGFSMRREKGNTPNGNSFNNFWVLRKEGQYIDHDQYRNDLVERHGMKCRRN
jgi:hypothetical protein